MCPQLIGGVNFGNHLPIPVIIGAGVAKHPAASGRWLRLAPTVAGSYTPSARAGNDGVCFYPEIWNHTHRFALNAWGMPNPGFINAAEMFSVISIPEHPLIISIAGFSCEDYVLGVRRFETLKPVSAIELNFGCPNTGEQILSFDLKTMERLFATLRQCRLTKPLWVKLSPYSDPLLLKQVAAVIGAYHDILAAVVTCNTFPNAYAGNEAITANAGFGGMSGPALKPIALGQVRQFRALLPSTMSIVGMGGIMHGDDIIDFNEAGADAVALTTLPVLLGEPGRLWDTLLSGPQPMGSQRWEKRLTAYSSST